METDWTLPLPLKISSVPLQSPDQDSGKFAVAVCAVDGVFEANKASKKKKRGRMGIFAMRVAGLGKWM